VDRSHIEPVIAALDAAVPKDGAHVVIHQYGGGPDECSIVANERGYLRLGIELLKAAFAPAGYQNRRDAIEVDVDYVIRDDSEIQLDWFERREPDAPPVPRTRFSDLAAMACGLFLVTMFVIGCMTAVNWLTAAFT
jgi:hypothetical protein